MRSSAAHAGLAAERHQRAAVVCLREARCASITCSSKLESGRLCDRRAAAPSRRWSIDGDANQALLDAGRDADRCRPVVARRGNRYWCTRFPSCSRSRPCRSRRLARSPRADWWAESCSAAYPSHRRRPATDPVGAARSSSGGCYRRRWCRRRTARRRTPQSRASMSKNCGDAEVAHMEDGASRRSRHRFL